MSEFIEYHQLAIVFLQREQDVNKHTIKIVYGFYVIFLRFGVFLYQYGWL